MPEDAGGDSAELVEDTWLGAVFALVGLLGSVALFAVSERGRLLLYEDAAVLSETSSTTGATTARSPPTPGWTQPAGLPPTMVLARAVIKGPEELYNQLWAQHGNGARYHRDARQTRPRRCRRRCGRH